MAVDQAFTSVGLKEGMRRFADLHRNVVSAQGRVKIVGDSPESEAVLISKVELDSLEHALEILATTPAAGQMRRKVKRIAKLDRDAAGLAATLPESSGDRAPADA
jgi:PHD/YefM family antitoxin component YafN of YafNO toxin-antitoxin module